jgi:hypothetical protein
LTLGEIRSCIAITYFVMGRNKSSQRPEPLVVEEERWMESADGKVYHHDHLFL